MMNRMEGKRMKKKLLAITMAVLLGLAFASVLSGCGNADDEHTTEAATEAVMETDSAADTTLVDLSGDWQDSVSQRATMTITASPDGQTADVTVIWSDSADETNQWTMTVRQEGDRLIYDSCEETETEFNSDGSVHEEDRSVEGGGFFEIGSSGEINWTGAGDDDCRICSFRKIID